MRSRPLLVIASAALLPACYHATIDTGRSPSGQVIEQKWSNSFVYGLVPPPIVQTAQRCPNGIAKVDTQLSFLNQLVSVLTLGIYTPMDIRVSCASAGSASRLLDGRSDPAGALQRAAEQVYTSGVPVLVRF